MKTTFKKAIIAFFVLPFFIGSTVDAQHDIDINAAGIFYKNFGIDYEYVINDQTGAGLSFTYAQNTLGMSIPSGVDFSAYEITPEFKFYPIPSQGADKFFVSVYLKYKSAKWEDMSYMLNNEETFYDLTYSGTAMGFQAGYKMLFRSNFYMEASVGMGRYLFANWDDTGDKKYKLSEDENNDYNDKFLFNWDIRFALGLGYRFGGNAAK